VIGKMTVIAKSEILYVAGTFGISSWLMGLTFVKRNAGGKAAQAINETVVELNKQNIKLWVFPEGTRRNTGEIHEFKKGAFHAAIHAQVSIVPVVFSSYKKFLDQKKKVFTKGEIIITALPEISTKGLTSRDVDGLIERTRHQMIETYDRTSAETSASLNS
jgi:lysophosphatidate acyltransferase